MMKRFAVLLLSVCACRGLQETGKVLRFHMEPAAGSPVLTYSSDVEARREDADLVLKLTNVGVGYNPQAPIIVREVSATAYAKTSEAKIGESNRYHLENRRDSSNYQLTFPQATLRVKGAGKPCFDGCIVVLNLYYRALNPNTASRESMAESQRTAIDLKNGTITAVGKETAPTVADTGPCRWLTEAEASEALGQPVVYREKSEPESCKVGPRGSEAAGDSILWIEFKVTDDPKPYTGFVQRDDAAVLSSLGDRAVWNSQLHSVAVVKGNRMLTLHILDSKVPSTLGESELQEKAAAAVQRIVAKM